MKSQTIRILLLILGALIIALSLYCFNKYLMNDKNEPFYTYQPINPGDPLSTNNDDITIKNISGIISATSPPTSGKTYIINTNQNTNTNLCIYNPITEYSSCFSADINDVPTPTATTALVNDNIRCNNNGGYLLTANSKTTFYYNQNINNQKRTNCLYYIKKINNIPELSCFPLPTISLSNTTPQTTDSSGKTNMPYDKLRFISANDSVILAMGCSNTLYYYPLVNSLPSDTSNNTNVWKVIYSGSLPIEPASISDIKVNDTTAFLYSRKVPVANFKIMFAPLTMDGNNLNLTWTPWISGENLTYQYMLLNGTTFTVNNDVLWFASINNSGASIVCNLWWANLVNGAPKLDNSNGIPASNWQQFTIGNALSSITSMCIINNFLTIYTNNQVLLIALKPNTTTPTVSNTNTTIPSITNSITTITSGNTHTNSGTTTGIATIATTLVATTPGATNPDATNANDEPNATDLFGNPLPTTTRINGTTIPMTTKPTMTTKPSNTKLMAYEDSNMAPGSISGMFGISGNTNNHDNLNDFLANTNLVGNNLYISPMNNEELYKPQQPKVNGKISSSFFPMVRIN